MDDVAYADVVRFAREYRSMKPEDLLADLEGLYAAPQLGLAAQLQSGGSVFARSLKDLVLEAVRTRDVTADEYLSSLRLRTIALGYDMGFGVASALEQQEVQQEIFD